MPLSAASWLLSSPACTAIGVARSPSAIERAMRRAYSGSPPSWRQMERTMSCDTMTSTTTTAIPAPTMAARTLRTLWRPASRVAANAEAACSEAFSRSLVSLGSAACIAATPGFGSPLSICSMMRATCEAAR